MMQLLIGTFILGLVHALIPNHWLPLVAIAKNQKWPKSELMFVATITACAHVLGTVALGVTLGLVGSKLAHEYETYLHFIAPVLLILFGLIYFSMNTPHQHHTPKEYVEMTKKSRRRWMLIFILMMFLSPCWK